jgi:hypothetical protein
MAMKARRRSCVAWFLLLSFALLSVDGTAQTELETPSTTQRNAQLSSMHQVIDYPVSSISAQFENMQAELPSTGLDGLATRNQSLYLDSIPDILPPTTPATLLYSWRGETSTEWFGFGVGSAGDINGDDHDDVIIGAPNAGSAIVYSGADGSELLRLNGTEIEASLGWSVTGGADFNQDGFDDVLVSAVGIDTVFAYSGKDGTELYHVTATPGFFGEEVSLLGDLNGDQIAEFVVGASDTPPSYSGAAYVFSGADGELIYEWYGQLEYDNFGTSVASAGDINGDGIDDIAVGFPGRDYMGYHNLGGVSLYSGTNGSLLRRFGVISGGAFFQQFGASVSSAGDVDGDGRPNLIVGANTAPSVIESDYAGRAFLFSSPPDVHDLEVIFETVGNPCDWLGSSVARTSDMNGDGVPDFLIGAPSADPGASEEAGSTYLRSGADYSVIERFDGNEFEVNLGEHVAAAGDVDGNSSTEIILGGSGYSGGIGEGRVYGWPIKFVASGSCPGEVRLELSGATVTGWVGLVGSKAEGKTTIPSGIVCAGGVLGLESARFQKAYQADVGGSIVKNPTLEQRVCGAYLQAVDVTTCVRSNVIQIPGS